MREKKFLICIEIYGPTTVSRGCEDCYFFGGKFECLRGEEQHMGCLDKLTLMGQYHHYQEVNI